MILNVMYITGQDCHGWKIYWPFRCLSLCLEGVLFCYLKMIEFSLSFLIDFLSSNKSLLWFLIVIKRKKHAYTPPKENKTNRTSYKENQNNLQLENWHFKGVKSSLQSILSVYPLAWHKSDCQSNHILVSMKMYGLLFYCYSWLNYWTLELIHFLPDCSYS